MENIQNLWNQMHGLTLPECQKCKIPYSCCSREYCEFVLEEHPELKRTDHKTLPLMGPNGCTAAPHLRPLCTLHTCEINSIGIKKNDPEWTKKYFELREKINDSIRY